MMLYTLLSAGIALLSVTHAIAHAGTSVPFSFQNEVYARGAHVEYKIQDGHLFERGAESSWKLQGGIGLPFQQKTQSVFSTVHTLKHVYADADCIAVTDQDDRVYFYESPPSLIGSRQPYAWTDTWGEPLHHPLYLQANFRAVSFSRHTDESLKYMEDALGIAHNAGGDSYLINWHKEKRGHSGLTHFYALSEDGTQLFFADSGLPAGITYQYPLPRARLGNPVAIASRGSVVAILNDRAEVFTKLLDFDFLGHNPMMYGYRYNAPSLIEELSHFHFTDLTPSHYGTINLPYPDWKKHELLISGPKADLSLGASLDMETTGPGIHNREIFLQVKNKKGGCGILRKTLNEPTWRLEPIGSNINEPIGSKLNKPIGSKSDEDCQFEMLSQHTTTLHTRRSFHFTGDLRVENETFPFEISDFDLVNYENNAVITVQGLPISMKLHTVFAWSPFRVENPGFNGRPKLFHVTFDLPDDSDLPAALRALHFETFSTWLWGTEDHLRLESRNEKVKGELFSDSNTSHSHFIKIFTEKQKREEIKKRLKVAAFEKTVLAEMNVTIQSSRGATSAAFIQYWPRALDATFPPLKRLLFWGHEIVKQRLKIAHEEVTRLQKTP